MNLSERKAQRLYDCLCLAYGNGTSGRVGVPGGVVHFNYIGGGLWSIRGHELTPVVAAVASSPRKDWYKLLALSGIVPKGGLPR
jgi:hypothetical protein